MYSPQQTLKPIYNTILTLFCEELTKEYKRLSESVIEEDTVFTGLPPTSILHPPQLGLEFNVDDNAFAKQEAEYHIKTHDNCVHLAMQPLHTLLSPTYKLLTDRTLDILYESAFNRFIVIQPERATYIAEHILNPGLHKWFKTLIFTAPEVNNILNPIVSELITHVEKEIKRLDQIPYIEQKTPEWLKFRANMISASVAGYCDAFECGCGMSKEYGQIREKAGLQSSKSIGWGSASIRHGMTFEDLSGSLYNIFNGLTSKEYGILPDDKYPCIGASPDGIVIDVNDRENWQSLRKLGRMREIKNPTSRLINQRVPETYYWQMTQQMYVCRLPMCDFIQTSFAYPNSSTPSVFIKDTLDIKPVLAAKNWQCLVKALKPLEYADEEYISAANTMNESLILDKLDWITVINNIGRDALLSQYQIQDLNRILTRFVVENWESARISKIPFANINRAGNIKGILWCFTKPDTLGGTDFNVLFMDPATPITSTEQIAEFYKKNSGPIIQQGFKLESTHYWDCKKYLEFEVEYNQGLYDNAGDCILNRLLKKWELVMAIRAEPNQIAKEELFSKFYPNTIKDKKSINTLRGTSDKKTWGYTKRIKKDNSNTILLTDIPELDLS